MAVRVGDRGESEGCSVMEQISVASVLSTTSPNAKAGKLPHGAAHAVTWKATGSDCLHRKDADRLSHQMYPTRQSGEATDCSGTLGQCTRTPRSGAGTARRRCTCQHRGGEGLGWIAW